MGCYENAFSTIGMYKGLQVVSMTIDHPPQNSSFIQHKGVNVAIRICGEFQQYFKVVNTKLAGAHVPSVRSDQ